VNLYGPPLSVSETNNQLRNLGKRAVALGETTDHMNLYQNFPELASTYRGRVLTAERIVAKLPKGHEKNKVAWNRKVKRCPFVPTNRKYALRAFIGGGTEIPQFSSATSLGTRNKRMWIRVSVGPYEVSTEKVENNNGVCEWYNLIQIMEDMILPEDPDQLPDVFVHLM
ncbi:unnamed protein product, partial [Choristocarpus tenellus]